jgi:RNA polymerase sigma factor (sigma-70 family)
MNFPGSESALSSGLRRLAIEPLDEDAWRTLFERLWPFVISVVWRRLKDRSAAEDAAQEVFLRLLRMRPFPQISEPEEFKAYVWRMSVNVAHDYTAKRDRLDRDREAMSILESPGRRTGEHLGDGYLLFEEVVGLATADLAEDEYRILKCLISGMDIHEIGKTLGLSYSATAVRVHRLRRKLGKLLKS